MLVTIMKNNYSIIAILILTLFCLSSCSTIESKASKVATFSYEDKDNNLIDNSHAVGCVYSGVYLNTIKFREIPYLSKGDIRLVIAPFYIIDFSLSLVADTILLTSDIPHLIVHPENTKLKCDAFIKKNEMILCEAQKQDLCLLDT